MSGPAEFGPYLVYEELGSGAMASVHRAETRGAAGFRKAIALKRLHPQLTANEELVQAFVYEARLASHLKHGNIVQTFDFGKVDDTYFIAMELARGPTLKQLIRQCVSAAGAMPLPIAIGVVIQICDALDHAHNITDETGKPLGIVHRDVSPSNVIIDNSGIVKLIDFGIAKVKSRNVQTQAGTIKGKFGYIAPEYLAGQIDHRADLFAVGVLTHELLTSRQLFTAENEWETLSKIREMPIQPPSRWNPQVPMELDHIVLTALQRDPSLRWQNAGALRNALTGVLKDANEVVTDKIVADWVIWAFSQKPRNDDSAMVRLIDDLEPSVSVEIVKEASSPVEPRDTPEGKTVVLAAKEAVEASQAPAVRAEFVPARSMPPFEGTVELVPASRPADGDPLALFPGLTRASRDSHQPIPMGPMPTAPERPVLGSASARLAAQHAAARMSGQSVDTPPPPGSKRAAPGSDVVEPITTPRIRGRELSPEAAHAPPSSQLADEPPTLLRDGPPSRAAASPSSTMAAQPPGPRSSKMAAQDPAASRMAESAPSSRMAAEGPPPSRMVAQPPPTPPSMAPQPPPGSPSSRMAAEGPPSSRMAAQPPPTPPSMAAQPAPGSSRMPAEGPPSSRMAAQQPPSPPGISASPSSKMPTQPPPIPSSTSAQPRPTPSNIGAQPRPTPSNLAAQPAPRSSSMASQPPPVSARMAAQPAPASTRMLVEAEPRAKSTRMAAEPGVVMPVYGSQSSGVVLDKKLPVKRPYAPRRRRARWWLIVLLILVAGGATAGYFEFPQIRAWWAERIS